MSDGSAPAASGAGRHVVLDVGSGALQRFVVAWADWQREPARCRGVHYIAIEPAPPARVVALGATWPPATPDLHRRVLDDGAVQLLLAVGDAARWLPQLDARVDEFVLADAVAGDARLAKSIARLAVPGAVVRTTSGSAASQAILGSVGFRVEEHGDGCVARYAPRHVPRPAPARRSSGDVGAASGKGRTSADDAEPIVIVGAGLAGCATAHALAELGRSSLVLERGAAPAGEGSGNAVGLFHGVVHGVDGRHARFHRAAALAAHAAVAAALANGEAGALDGLLRVETSGASRADMQARLDRLGLPPAYAHAVDAAEASAIAGTAIGAPAWFYAGGGWVDPRGLCRAYLARAASRVAVRTGCTVASITRDGDRWRLADAEGREVARARVVVLANAGGAFDLLGARDWPVRRSRGQLSSFAEVAWPAGAPRVPVTGAGYVVPAHAGEVWFGATSQHDDADPAVRDADHHHNLARLRGLLASAPADSNTTLGTIGTLGGRVGFRWVADDRLPIVGAVPCVPASTNAGRLRLDQPRFVPRAPGLYVIAALGSRGIAGSAIGGAVIAAAVSGAPSPLANDLLDAIDPARFVSRAVRRGVQPPVGVIDAGSEGD